MIRRIKLLKAKGATLLEMIVTVVILLLLGTLAISEFASLDKRAHRNAKLTNLEALGKALRMYKLDYKAYPPSGSPIDVLAPYTNVTSLRTSFDATAADPPGGIDIQNQGNITVYFRALIKGVNKPGANWDGNGSYNIKYYIEPPNGNPAEGGELVCKWIDDTGGLIHDWQACEKGL